ncbi:hypothetical protein (nucleomorph) [Guillardia theta]|uniref:Uncharacterized protein n=2 Tax=Guillardia theta TaxID=55529 RepID=Q98RZ8_GUITH|nr:hypothetical protein GTHECHR1010 [Guillardia theta]AAK39802.1 hypothetical protein [Guillardia theta]
MKLFFDYFKNFYQKSKNSENYTINNDQYLNSKKNFEFIYKNCEDISSTELKKTISEIIKNEKDYNQISRVLKNETFNNYKNKKINHVEILNYDFKEDQKKRKVVLICKEPIFVGIKLSMMDNQVYQRNIINSLEKNRKTLSSLNLNFGDTLKMSNKILNFILKFNHKIKIFESRFYKTNKLDKNLYYLVINETFIPRSEIIPSMYLHKNQVRSKMECKFFNILNNNIDMYSEFKKRNSDYCIKLSLLNYMNNFFDKFIIKNEKKKNILGKHFNLRKNINFKENTKVNFDLILKYVDSLVNINSDNQMKIEIDFKNLIRKNFLFFGKFFIGMSFKNNKEKIYFNCRLFTPQLPNIEFNYLSEKSINLFNISYIKFENFKTPIFKYFNNINIKNYFGTFDIKNFGINCIYYDYIYLSIFLNLNGKIRLKLVINNK